ncbi:MAG: peptide chain release factor N(5)-glutamine methyltransferase [Gammaproteobacteria bacterium]|nr:peptide chain release factor N(5)-glutamine methyltransferase [Gammaproteobacteria bacterium]
MIIRQLLAEAGQQLAQVSESPRLDAEVLLCHLLDKDRSYLLTWPDKALDEPVLAAFQQLLQQRLAGTPVAHLTGQREFWSLPLQINQHTLIPRPDTECLVEQVLQAYPASAQLVVADLGTGSGAIALALASERPNWQIVATDSSTEALQVARSNAASLGINNIEFRQGNWLAALPAIPFDIIASNPPYICDADPHLQQGDVRFEPLSALASGEDGLDAIRHICSTAMHHLKPGGLLILEHGYDQQQAVADIFHINGFKTIHQASDLGHNPRTTSGNKPK